MKYEQENPECDKTANFHNGIVESFENGLATVKIYHGSNCGTCSSKGGCAAGGLGESGQTVEVKHSGHLEIGQNVNVVLRAKTDFLAIILAFAIPIVLLIASILGLVKLGANQLQAGLAAIGVVGAYLGVLVIFRKQLQSKFELMIAD